jgi:hypothetical protein
MAKGFTASKSLESWGTKVESILKKKNEYSNGSRPLGKVIFKWSQIMEGFTDHVKDLGFYSDPWEDIK